MSRTKEKFYTQRYSDQMEMLKQLMGISKDTVLKKLIENNPAPAKNVDEMSLDDIIVQLYRCIGYLAANDTTLVTLTDSEGQLASVEKTIELIDRKIAMLSAKYNFEEKGDTEICRKLSYITDVLSIYHCLQHELDNIEYVYYPGDELKDVKSDTDSYETYQPVFQDEVDKYNKYIKSKNFNAELFPEEILGKLCASDSEKAKLKDGFAADHIFEKNNTAEIIRLTDNYLNEDINRLSEIQQNRNEKINEFRSERNGLIMKENARYDSRLLDEAKRHEAAREEYEANLAKLNEIKASKRPAEKESAYADVVSEYKNEKFGTVSSAFRNGGYAQEEEGLDIDLSWIEELGDASEIENRSVSLEASLADLKAKAESLSKEIEDNKVVLEDLKNIEDECRKAAGVPLEKDDEYISRKGNLDAATKSLDDINKDTEEVKTQGCRYITKAVLEKYSVDAEPIDYQQKDKDIEANRLVVYQQIGKGTFKWPKLGKALLKSIQDIAVIFKEDDLSAVLLASENSFAKIESAKDVLCLDSLIKAKSKLSEFSESINGDAPEDKIKQKDDVLAALTAIEEAEKNEVLMSAVLKVFELSQKVDEEKNLEEKLLAVLSEKKTEAEKNIEINSELVNSYEESRNTAVSEAENRRVETEECISNLTDEYNQNLLDTEFVELCIKISTDQKDQREFITTKEKNEIAIADLNDKFDEEKRLSSDNKFNIQAEYNSLMEKIQKECDDKEKELDDSLYDEILSIKNRAEQLKDYKEYLISLNSVETELYIRADALGRTLNKFLYRKPLFKEKLRISKGTEISSINKIEDASIERMLSTIKTPDTFAECEEIAGSLKEYLATRNATPSETVTSKSFVEISENLAKSLEKYVTEKFDNVLAEESETLRVDEARFILKILDFKEKVLKGFEKESKIIDETKQKDLTTKSSAEEKLIDRCEMKPSVSAKAASKKSAKSKR